MRRTLHALHARHATPDRRAARLLSRFTQQVEPGFVAADSSLDDLEQVLERYSARSLLAVDSVGAQAMRGAIRRLAAEARARDPQRAEVLLLSLRCAWRDFPQVRQLADQETRDALWRRLVRVCCEEFYAPRGDVRRDQRSDARGDGLTARVEGRLRLA